MTTSVFATEVVSLAGFTEEEKAVAMAKCSRSSNTFMEDALATREKGNAGKFNETVVVAYGHNSVADMSIGSLCFEGLSVLVSEDFFDIQTGKFQGKSSRYVPFSRDRVVQPFLAMSFLEHGERMAQAHLAYNNAVHVLFDAYEGLHAPVRAWVVAQENMQGQPESVINARVFDALRYLLPLGTLTNFGTRLSGRDTAELIRRLLADDRLEAQDVAGKIKGVSDNETPTLVRHAELKPCYQQVKRIFANLPETVFQKPDATWGPVELMDVFGDAENVIDTIAFEERGVEGVRDTQAAAAWEALDAFMATRQTRHDPIPHAYRVVRYVFGIEADFGCWKDLRRHRRNELFRAPFTSLHGFTVPEDILAIAGEVEVTYRNAMEVASAAFVKIQTLGFPEEARYATTHGHTQRWVMDLDGEQLLYLAELRTEPFGHISYRRVARRMFDLARAEHPRLYTHHRVSEVHGVEAHA